MCGRKTKNKILEMAVKTAGSCEDFLSQQQIVLLSWSSLKAEQSWLDWHWGGEIKLQGRSEKQPAGRCGRAHSELLKWPESIVKGGDSPRSQQADFQQALGLLRYINAMSRAVKWQKRLPKWRQPAHLTSLYCGMVGKKEEAPSALFLY